MKANQVTSAIIVLLLFLQTSHARSLELSDRNRVSSLFLAADMLEVVKDGKPGLVESSYPEEIKDQNSAYTAIIEKLKSKEKWEIIGAHKYISREIARIFHKSGFQGHHDCIEMSAINKQEVDAIFSVFRKNSSKEEFSRVMAMASTEIDNGFLNFREGFEISFKNTYENSAICRKIEGSISKKAPAKAGEECPLSAQSYEDLFKSKRRVNDFKCYQKALEREL